MGNNFIIILSLFIIWNQSYSEQSISVNNHNWRRVRLPMGISSVIIRHILISVFKITTRSLIEVGCIVLTSAPTAIFPYSRHLHISNKSSHLNASTAPDGNLVSSRCPPCSPPWYRERDEADGERCSRVCKIISSILRFNYSQKQVQ